MGRGDQGLLSGAAGGTYVFRWFECPEICALGRSRVVVAKDKIEMPAGSNVEYSAQEMCQAEQSRPTEYRAEEKVPQQLKAKNKTRDQAPKVKKKKKTTSYIEKKGKNVENRMRCLYTHACFGSLMLQPGATIGSPLEGSLW